jgi:hypothetical protein
VLLDVLNSTTDWVDWSEQQLETARLAGPLLINDVIYAEFSVRFDAPQDVDGALRAIGVDLSPMPKVALFLAGKASAKYRRAGGTRTMVLPDFFIGAHAAASKLPLLTRDPNRIRTYFPTVDLITPPRQ